MFVCILGNFVEFGEIVKNEMMKKNTETLLFVP